MRSRRLTGDDVEALVQAAGNLRDAAMVRFLANTGLRVSEATGLEARDIRHEWMTVRAETAKNKKGGVLPLNSAARQALSVLLQNPSAGIDSNARPIFRGRRGDRLTARAVQKILSKIGAAVGFHVHPHQFRHFFLTELLSRGVPIHVVRGLARHSSIAVTNTYLHERPEQMLDAVKRLGGDP